MKRKFMLFALCSVLTFGMLASAMASTVFDDVDESVIEAYENTVSSINTKYDIKAIKMLDMDGDGIQEIVVKYADSSKNYIECYTLNENNVSKFYSYNESNSYSGDDIETELMLTKNSKGAIFMVLVNRNEEKGDFKIFNKNGQNMESKIVVSYDMNNNDAKYVVDNATVNKSTFDTTMKNYFDLNDDVNKYNTVTENFNYIPKLEMDTADSVLAVFTKALNEKGDEDSIKVYINEKALATDNYPIIKNGTTMVPMRDIFEALNCTVQWDSSTKSVTAKKNKTTIKLTVNSKNAEINNKMKILAEAPYVNENGATMVPLRFVSEALGAEVEWNGEDRTINITL